MPGLLFTDLSKPFFHELPGLATQDLYTLGRSPGSDLFLPDPRVSRYHARISTQENLWLLEDRSRNGTRINGRLVHKHPLSPGDRIEIGRFCLEYHLQAPFPTFEPDRVTVGVQQTTLMGQASIFKKMLTQAERAAQTDFPILILGETGTGKELLAQYIHENSPRSSHPFVAINCAALSPALMENELFGHERGAFTGASDRQCGVFESANQGTLFLDEIGELPLDLQPKLLRALECHKIRRIGSKEETPLDTRVLAATNRDLWSEVKAGTFREDLFHRLHVISIRVPSLRERRSDIAELSDYLLKSAGLSKIITPQALAYLTEQNWPGNIRQLRNVLIKAAVLTSGSELQEESLEHFQESLPTPTAAQPDPPGSLEGIEREMIQKHLSHHQWNRLKTAESLGISRSALYMKMRKYGL